MNNDVLNASKYMNDDVLMICPVRCSQVIPDEIVCGLSLMIDQTTYYIIRARPRHRYNEPRFLPTI